MTYETMRRRRLEKVSIEELLKDEMMMIPESGQQL
jgi:hypothetical protein